MTAVPSASKIERGPSRHRHPGRDSLERAFAVLADLEVGNVTHVERVIGIGIGIARRAGIEMAAGGGEVRLALADGVQMDAVQPGLETARRDGDVDNHARALLAFHELDLPGDAVAFDLGVRAASPCSAPA